MPIQDPTDANKSWSDNGLEEDIPKPNTARPDSLDDILRPSQLTNNALQPPSTTSSQQTANTPDETQPPSQPRMPFEENPTPRKVSSKWFQITVDWSRLIHQDFVERQPFWKYFTPMKSMAQEDLAKVVPHVGLSDVSKRPPNHHRTPNKVLKVMADYVEHRMPSLKEMYDEGGREKH